MPERFDIFVRATPQPALVASGFFMARDRMQQMVDPLTRVVDEVIIPEIMLNFAEEGRPEHWPELSERQKKAREREGYDAEHPILRASEDLYNAAIDPGSWTISQEPRGAVAMYNEEMLPEYAFFHLTGAHVFGGGFMPVRDWAYISDQALDESEDIFWDFIENALEAVPG